MASFTTPVEAGRDGVPDLLDARKRYASDPERRFRPDQAVARVDEEATGPGRWSYYWFGPVVTKSGDPHRGRLRSSTLVDRGELPAWVLEAVAESVEAHAAELEMRAAAVRRAWAIEASR